LLHNYTSHSNFWQGVVTLIISDTGVCIGPQWCQLHTCVANGSSLTSPTFWRARY